MNLQIGCDLYKAQRCFGGAQRPGDKDMSAGEVGSCVFGSHYKPRFICGLGTDIPNLQNKVEAYAFKHGKLEKVSLSWWCRYPYVTDGKVDISPTKGDPYAQSKRKTRERHSQGCC